MKCALFLVVFASAAAGPVHAGMPSNVLCDMRRLALDFAASIMPERATGGGKELKRHRVNFTGFCPYIIFYFTIFQIVKKL